MTALYPYLLGALGGAGALLIFYGFTRIRGEDRDERRRRRGLWLVNLGVLLMAASIYLLTRSP